MEVIGWELRQEFLVLTHRREEMRPLVVHQDNRNRLLEVGPTRIRQWPIAPVAYTTLVLPSSTNASKPCWRMAAWIRHPLTTHPREVRLRRDQRRCSHGHQSCRHQASIPR